MQNRIRAIYQHGQLRLLEDVDLVDGQEVELVILDQREQVRAALSDLLVNQSEETAEPLNEDALQREIDADFEGQPPLSEAIIEERKSGR
jgi:predicted DNA-binding antitoxin AbrB/MazE fold protein